jgi:hypothetical protein
VALVDHDESVAVEQRRVVASGEALDHRHVDHTGWLVAAATDLTHDARVDAEVVVKA